MKTQFLGHLESHLVAVISLILQANLALFIGEKVLAKNMRSRIVWVTDILDKLLVPGS